MFGFFKKSLPKEQVITVDLEKEVAVDELPKLTYEQACKQFDDFCSYIDSKGFTLQVHQVFVNGQPGPMQVRVVEKVPPSPPTEGPVSQ